MDVCTKFQIDISKHVERSPENFEKSKMRKIIAKIPKKKYCGKRYLCLEMYRGLPVYQI